MDDLETRIDEASGDEYTALTASRSTDAANILVFRQHFVLCWCTTPCKLKLVIHRRKCRPLFEKYKPDFYNANAPKMKVQTTSRELEPLRSSDFGKADVAE
jgi:hypothetical protein